MAHRSELLALARLHRRMFLNGLEGLPAADLVRRGAPSGGFPAGVAAHLVDARRFLATMVGAKPRHPALETLEALSTVDDPAGLPPVPELLAAWGVVSDALETALAQLSSEALEASTGHDFPIEDQRLLGGITFLFHHEAYHLGQLGLLRRQLGHPGMRYG